MFCYWQDQYDLLSENHPLDTRVYECPYLNSKRVSVVGTALF